MPKARLDTRFLSHACCPDGKRKETYFDTSMRGLCLEVRVSGGRTFYLRYRDTRGKTRYAKLADAQHVTLPQARTLCDRMRNKIAMGIDPLAERAVKRQVPTFADFARDRYMPFSQANKRSWQTDDTLIRTHLIPAFGSKHLDEITTEDVLTMQQAGLEAGAAPGSVNRRLILLRYMFNLA